MNVAWELHLMKGLHNYLYFTGTVMKTSLPICVCSTYVYGKGCLRVRALG